MDELAPVLVGTVALLHELLAVLRFVQSWNVASLHDLLPTVSE